MHWIDSHNHLQFPCLGAAAPLLEALRGAGVGCCVVNATREADWSAVAALARAYPETIVPAFGIHPWHAHEPRLEELRLEAAATAAGQARDSRLEELRLEAAATVAATAARLRGLLEQFPRAGVGECGLDRGVGAPGPEVQVPVFLGQVRLARDLQRTLTIHCVRAWGMLIDALLTEAPPPRLLLHGFSGSLETARRLLPMGAYFSCSGAILQPRRAAMLEVFRQLPRERILLETDAPESLPPPEYVSHPLADGRNHPANLPAIGGGLARALGMNAGEFAELTSHNAQACFGW